MSVGEEMGERGSDLLAHWPARTTPLPWIRIISFSSLLRASSLSNTNDVGSLALASTCNTHDLEEKFGNRIILIEYKDKIGKSTL